MKIKIGAFLSRWLTNKYVWVGVVLVLLLALYSFNPVNYVLMPKCAFKLATGYSCPGCGFCVPRMLPFTDIGLRLGPTTVCSFILSRMPCV